jgi:hypothetical protein
LVLLLLATAALAMADGYQAVTGKRLSKRPSRRTDDQMRRQSAIAAIVLGLMLVPLIVIALRG